MPIYIKLGPAQDVPEVLKVHKTPKFEFDWDKTINMEDLSKIKARADPSYNAKSSSSDNSINHSSKFT